MIRRHPHVFGDAPYALAADQTAAWEALKAAERAAKGARLPAGRRARGPAGPHPRREALQRAPPGSASSGRRSAR